MFAFYVTFWITGSPNTEFRIIFLDFLNQFRSMFIIMRDFCFRKIPS